MGMRIRGLALGALLLTLALAGCSDDGDGDGTGTSTSGTPITYGNTSSGASSTSASRSGTSTSSASSSSGAADNQRPTGAVSATVSGLNATFALSGSDPNGDAIVWDLAFGDGATANGTTLPATVTHTYAAGNYTATFTITDGSLQSTQTAVVAIVAAGAGFTGMEISGTVTLLCGPCAVESATFCVSLASGQNGLDCSFAEIPPEAVGRPYIVETEDGFIDMSWAAACEFMAAETENIDDATTPVEGTVPPGTGCVVVYEYLDLVPKTFKITIS